MDTREHFLWARERAMEYVKVGNGPNALASLIQDLGSHEGTSQILNDVLLGLAMGEAMLGGAEGARKFIEGLPVPAADPENVNGK